MEFNKFCDQAQKNLQYECESLQNFTLKSIFFELNEADEAELFHILKKHWETYVPICFKITDEPRYFSTQNAIDNILIAPIEAYICNCIEDRSCLLNLAQFNEPSKSCGKIFKHEEKAYFCQYSIALKISIHMLS